MSTDLTALEQRWQNLLVRRARLAERDTLAQQEMQRLLHEVTQAQACVEDAPHVREWLDLLQHAQHERAVGSYERMLTAFLRDVLPGEREAVLQLSTEKGLPALDFFIRKGDGAPLEDVLEGTGGSNANILSAGLRFIALMRSGRRRFLVMDEADCWMRPARAVRFATVVHSLAQQLGVQVLYISHHDHATLGGVFSHQLHLHHDAQGMLTTDWHGTTQEELGWAPDQVGLRSITLNDFQAHQSTHLPLGPGVTLVYGDNDIGKSAVVTALRAVIDNDSNDTFIRHHTQAARVTLDFGPDGVVHWDRQLKGKSKTNYRHMAAGATPLSDPLHTSKGRGAPEWMTRVLGLGRVDDLDIQIGRQKKPIFLLDEAPSMRAKALAVGNDGGYVQAMMAQERTELAEAKSTIKRGEVDLERWRRVRRVLEPLGGTQVGRERWQAMVDIHAQRQRIVHLIGPWQHLMRQDTVLANLPNIALVLPAPPRAPEAERLAVTWGGLSARERVLARAPSEDLVLLAAPVATVVRHKVNEWVGLHEQGRALAGVHSVDLSWPAPSRADQARPIAEQWRQHHQQASLLGTWTPCDLTLPQLGTSPTAWLREAAWRNLVAQQQLLEGLNAATLAWPAVQTSRAPSLAQQWHEQHHMDRDHQQDLADIDRELEGMSHLSVVCPSCGQGWHACQEGALA